MFVRHTEVAVDNAVRRKLSCCDIVVIELPSLVSPVAGRPRKAKFHERAAPSKCRSDDLNGCSYLRYRVNWVGRDGPESGSEHERSWLQGGGVQPDCLEGR